MNIIEIRGFSSLSLLPLLLLLVSCLLLYNNAFIIIPTTTRVIPIANRITSPSSSKLFSSSPPPPKDDKKKVNPEDYVELMRSQLIFGSDEDKKQSKDDTEEEEEDFRREQATRRRKVEALLKKHDDKFKEEQKQKTWGIYANATTTKDIKRVEREERKKIQKENAIKLALAKKSGINMELLEAKDTEEDSNSFLLKNIRVKSGRSAGGPESYFEELENDLEDEWDTLTREVSSKSSERQPSVMDDVMKDLDGGLTSRERMRGIRVGTAGGWTLEIFPGDFLVHQKYGIGRFEKTVVRKKNKLTKAEVAAQTHRRKVIIKDWLVNEKKGNATAGELALFRQERFGKNAIDNDPVSNPHQTVLEITYEDSIVHVPIDRAYRLSRYKGADSLVKPKLSKVRSKQWENAKRKVEENTLQIAQDVLALYATRETLVRKPFDPKYDDMVHEFCVKTFPYEPTPDQNTCFDAVGNDMVWRRHPMDRLICGDVGFGKTEVALRAIIRCIFNGRQAALLAPTGVLAAQHFKTTVERMSKLPEYKELFAKMDTPPEFFFTGLLRGGMGKNTKAGRAAREAIANGDWNVIVGTHALLGRDIEFKNLGLLVIDEEQRFGVKQKERLKLICSGVDVLTMSATPIPRTLQMSLSGIRDTSTLQSPPPMRKPIQTQVSQVDDDIIYEAISTELDRGGQCFYVVPRISMMAEAESRIMELFPGIAIISAHGRMGRNMAEQNVAAFAEGNYQVLLATTVIENGVDIPSVNTILIQNAENFGMSTLYQLRGRVGRSDQQAYAYFLHSGESVTEQAAMRLQAIGDLSALGSGFDVANRDLEIRGAGSLLGTEQSGEAARVGFDLYMRMLKKSIRQLRGLDVPVVPRTNFLEIEEANLEFFFIKDSSSSSSPLIPASYIPDLDQRYQAETSARLAESTAALVNITQEWKQTYGIPLPAELQTSLKTLHLHCCTKRIGIDVVGIHNGDCILRSPGLRPRHLQKILELLPQTKLPNGLRMIFPSRLTNKDDHGEDEAEFTDNKGVMDLKTLLQNPMFGDDNEDSDENGGDDTEDWDALDREEAMAMKEISSAMQLKGKLRKQDFVDHPRYIVPDFASQPDKIHTLLQCLLPLSKAIYTQQEYDKTAAKIATELREKRELITKQRKKQKKNELDAMRINHSEMVNRQYGIGNGGGILNKPEQQQKRV